MLSGGTVLLGIAALLFYVVGLAIKRLYFSPLSRFPGPKLPAATLWYDFYYDVVKGGQLLWQIEKMHEKYGPIVRINPHEIHIKDPDYYDELYSPSRKQNKYTEWVRLAGNENSGFSTVAHELHRTRRSVLNPFFSARSVSQLEPMINSKIQKLLVRLDEIAAAGEVIRFDVASAALTMDIITEYAFANDRRYLDEPDFKLEWRDTMHSAFKGTHLGRHLPWLPPIILALPKWAVSLIDPQITCLADWKQQGQVEVQPIMEGTDELSKKGGTARTIFHTLLHSDLPPKEKGLRRLCDEAELIMGAGSETAATTLSKMMFYITYRHETMEKLRDEFSEKFPLSGEVPTWAQLQSLPYCSAVIKESLRLSYGITTRLPRVFREDIQYKDYIIPAGTPVSETPYFVLMDSSVFPEPAEFRPERWIEAEQRGQRLDKYLVSFGRGPRQCLGLNLAYAELYLAVYALVSRFDWKLFETGLRDVVIQSDYFIAWADPRSKGVRMTLSKIESEAA